MPINYTIWNDLGTQLELYYKKRYFTPERYVADNPLENLVVLPGIEQFFGTKVFNIFIVSVPYGWVKDEDGIWVENWPPEGFEEAKSRHIANYDKFTSYVTYIYMDYYIVQLMEAQSANTRMREMMDQTKVRLTDLCSELVDYGFFMREDLNDPKDINYFKPVIDNFYTN